jgi:hypothetical protein
MQARDFGAPPGLDSLSHLLRCVPEGSPNVLKHLIMGCLVFSLALPVAGQNVKKKNRAKKDEVPVDADVLQPGTARGRLVTPPGLDGAFVVEIEVQNLEPKKGVKKPKNQAAAQINRLQAQLNQEVARAQADLARRKNPAAHYNRIVRLQGQLQTVAARAQAQSADVLKNYNVKKTLHLVEFHAAPEVKIRLKEPAQVFTEKGDIKKFTQEELRQLKGKNPNLPGYEGNLADLKSNQLVQVTQARAKTPPKKAKADADAGAGAEESKTHKNVATMILVLGEAPSKPVSTKKK